jgi:hypothetical protein
MRKAGPGVNSPKSGMIEAVRAFGSQCGFICEPCQEQDHEHCPGREQCDCQHRPPSPVPPVTGAPGE